MLAGCELYFGDGHDHDGGGGAWNYCGSDGYYTCEGDSCEWQGPTCPAGTGSGTTQPGGGSGFDCQANSDCAAGCYCASGTCEEAGFCTQDSDCGTGYVCNEDRSSCEPGTGPTKCDFDNECAVGQYCAPDHTCQATCVCDDDETAVAAGYGWCDETRSTCLPGQDPAGTCGGAATCNLVQPSCPSGQVPTLVDGCWTGQCKDVASCDIAPECGHINDQANCDSRQDCHEVVNGINCKITGTQTPCQAGAMNCTCDAIVFASCAAN
ncbi:MAG TPA: hypothetical protein VL326_35150 [Kofleriaceae bacterium]|nr:hypothetical protein [Kofleriaceae bacterium]